MDGNELLFDASQVIVDNSYLYEKTEELDENKADKEHSTTFCLTTTTRQIFWREAKVTETSHTMGFTKL